MFCHKDLWVNMVVVVGGGGWGHNYESIIFSFPLRF